MHASSALAAKPGHVPDAFVHDVDIFFRVSPGEDTQTAWTRIRDAAPADVFWTPRNGGHWVATRHADITRMQMDDGSTFSHEIISLPRAAAFPLYPLTLDPPRHAPFRRLIMPNFMPRALAALEDIARAKAIAEIDALLPKGNCEFVADFSSVLPIAVFLGMVDLPWEDRHQLLEWTEVMVRGSDTQARIAALQGMTGYLAEWLAKREANPGEDLLSNIVTGEVEGRPLTPQERMSVALLLLFGGLDTVASTLGFIARFLALNPGHRARLVSEPGLIPQAVEELVRRHGVSSTTRLVKREVVVANATLHPDDLILLYTPLAGVDDRVTPNPLEVDFDRVKPSHAGFGNGRHACVGAGLARREIQIFLEEWLRRIPNFSIAEGTIPLVGAGSVAGVLELHLEWTSST